MLKVYVHNATIKLSKKIKLKVGIKIKNSPIKTSLFNRRIIYMYIFRFLILTHYYNFINYFCTYNK